MMVHSQTHVTLGFQDAEVSYHHHVTKKQSKTDRLSPLDGAMSEWMTNGAWCTTVLLLLPGILVLSWSFYDDESQIN